MPWCNRRLRHQFDWNWNIFLNPDNEKSRSGMRQKVNGIDDKSAYTIFCLYHQFKNCSEILSSMGCNRTRNILQCDNLRRPTFFLELLNQFPERLERAASLTV